MVVVYVGLFWLLARFNIIHDHGFAQEYLFATPPIFLIFLINIYWIFPLTENHPLFSRYILSRLILSTGICTIPFAIILAPEHMPLPFILAACAVQLLAITPLSWLVYQERKTKILKLKGMEKALVKSKADLQFLRSQINPHFLFNTLNTLYGTALQEQAERTSEGIQKLGDMMRFMLQENTLDRIKMSREAEYLQNYIALQKLRTQTSADIVIEDNITGEYCGHEIAPMLLIPLVENAFKHGISLVEKSWIKILLECDEKQIRFSVLNSVHHKPDKDPEKNNTGIGLKNVQERLMLLYPGTHFMNIKKDEREFLIQIIIQF
jgi:hypothetical protein